MKLHWTGKFRFSLAGTGLALLAILFLVFSTMIECTVHASDISEMKARVPAAASYSPEEILTIRTMAIAPVRDNAGGIFSAFVRDKVADVVLNSSRFELVSLERSHSTFPQKKESIREDDSFFKKSGDVKKWAAGIDAEAVIRIKIFKKKNDIEMLFSMYSGKDGTLLFSERETTKEIGEISDIEKNTRLVFDRLIGRIPYRGTITSRNGLKVTVDIGAVDGVVNNSLYTVVRLNSVERHPLLKTVISVEDEEVGKIRITKVEKNLSFGLVNKEKDRNLIGIKSKIAATEYVEYDVSPKKTDSLSGPVGPPATKSGQMIYGKDPKEWKPEDKPIYGQMGMNLNFASFRNNSTYSGIAAREYKDRLSPGLILWGEAWVTQNWFVDLSYMFHVFSFTSSSGATPAALNSSLSQIKFNAGYRFLLTNRFWGPRFAMRMGFNRHSFFIDASNPEGLSSKAYSGVNFSAALTFPFMHGKYGISADLARSFFTRMTETPFTSGSGSVNSGYEFSFGGFYRFAPKWMIKSGFRFDFYKSVFEGTGTSSLQGLNSSSRVIYFQTGIGYMF